MVFGYWPYKEVIKVKWGYKGGVYILTIRDTRQFTSPSVHRRKTMWGHSEKVAIFKPGRELPPESEAAGTLILDSHIHCSIMYNKVDIYIHGIYLRVWGGGLFYVRPIGFLQGCNIIQWERIIISTNGAETTGYAGAKNKVESLPYTIYEN